MKYAEANRPAIYRKLKFEGLQVKKYAGAYPYSQGGLLMRSSLREPIYSYAKNYTKFKKDFSIFIWTTEADEAKVVKHFDSVVKKLQREQIMEVISNVMPFNYVEPSLV